MLVRMIIFKGLIRIFGSKEEIEKWRKKDPIRKFEKFLIKNRILKKEDLERINQEVEEEVRRLTDMRR